MTVGKTGLTAAVLLGRSRVLLWGVLALAFGLRVTGIGYGLPHIYHQDEPILVNHAMAIGASGWNPHFFVIGPFVIYCLFLLFGIYFVVGSATGVFADKNAFAAAFLNDPSAFYLLGRFFLGVVFGVATVALVYRIGRRFFSKEAGFLSALFLAILPVHVQHSHFIYADIPLTFAALLFFERFLNFCDEPSDFGAMVTGATAGWALSIKYTAAYFFPVVIAAYLVFTGGRLFRASELKRLGLGLLAALAIFALVAPYTFLDWEGFSSQVLRQSGAQFPVGWMHHLTYSLIGGAGAVYAIFSAVGFVRALISRRRAALLMAAFFTVYYSVNAYFSQPFARYMLPLVPFTALWAAEGWLWTAKHFTLGRPVRIFVLAAIALDLFSTTAWSDTLLLRKDTRTLCAEWVEANVPAGSVIAVDNRFFSPRLKQSREQILEKFTWLGQEPKDAIRKKRLELELEAAGGGVSYSVFVLKPLNQAGAVPAFVFEGPYLAADARELKKRGVDFVILNYSDFEPELHLKKSLGDNLEKVAFFGPYFRPKREKPEDVMATTGPPHLANELFARKRLGPALNVYRVAK